MSETIFTAGQVSAIVQERMRSITLANECETDIGSQVYMGRRIVADEDIGSGAITVIEGIDTVTSRPGRIPNAVIEQRYALVAYLPCDPDQPNAAAHAAIRDLKRAIFKGNATFEDRVRTVKYLGRDIGTRADGARYVVALVEIAVEYVEDLTKP